MEYWVIDRWESELVICHNEQGKRQEMPKYLFPEDAKEGDWFLILENGDVKISSKETKKRQDEALNLRKRLLLR